jgi:arsenate reductase
MLTLFGIANCDTVKKAQRWLEQHAIDYRFHDFRRDGLDSTVMQKWLKQVDWSDLLNQRSRTWRELDADQKQNLSKDKALQLMLDHPTLIKRPVIINKNVVIIGFHPDEYQSQLT